MASLVAVVVGVSVACALNDPIPTENPTPTHYVEKSWGPLPPPTVPPEVADRGLVRGWDLFIGLAACSACHTVTTIDIDHGLLGPDLTHVGTLASRRIPGYSAEQYIRESIVDPCAYNVSPTDAGIAQGYNCNLMIATMAGITLTDTDVDALVAFLLEQR